MADRPDDRQLDDPARQQPQRPARVALRGRPQTQGDDLRLLFAVEPLEAQGATAAVSMYALVGGVNNTVSTGLASVNKRIDDVNTRIDDVRVDLQRLHDDHDRLEERLRAVGA